MRVALDVYHALFPSGVKTYIDGLAGALARGPVEEIVLFANYLRPWGAALPAPLSNGTRIRTRRLRLPRRAVEGIWRRLHVPPIEWLVGGIDVFHATHFVVPPARRARLVLSIHDIAYLRDRGHFYEKELNDYLHEVVLPEALARVDRVIASSASTRRDLIEILRLAPEKVTVVHLGMGPVERPQAEEIDAVYRNFGIERPAIVYPVGTITARKNLVRAFEAFRTVLDQGRDIRLVLTGIGGLPPAEASAIETLGLAPHVRRVCFEERRELFCLLAGADAAIYPSLYEGFGFPALEALACGAPLVASNVSSIPEVVGDAGLLVDPRDPGAIAAAIVRILDDPDLRRDLAARGPDRARGFSWDRCADRTIEVYEEVLSRR
ncbi:MAG: glycosyltransferase family 4 protein [Planctomycetes bacterium]|nr:glycosyltransferase family 4 protein [Planctomycetota bacterium]